MSRCDQNGPPARREEGAYPKPYVTDEQRSRRPIFIATLRAAAGWLFFLRRGGSLRIKSRYTRRSRLEKQPTDRRRNIHVFRGQDTYRSVYSSLLPCSEGISRTGFSFPESKPVVPCLTQTILHGDILLVQVVLLRDLFDNATNRNIVRF